MTKAVHARRRGDDFQAYCFWRRACHMLMASSDIEEVGFELSSPYVVFDDVAVKYRKGRPWRGQLVPGEFTQVKHSVNYSKALTFDALCDPAFINATSVSFMQRLYNAVQTMQANGDNHRFVLLAPWAIQPDDVLAHLVCCEDGSLDLHRLFDGTGRRGVMGQLRQRLVDHLGLSSEDELRPILERLQIAMSRDTLESLREQLWGDLGAAGLRQIDLSSRTDTYVQLPWRLHQEGKEWHTAQSLRSLAEQEGLWVGASATAADPRTRLGIRTFMRWAEDMEVTADYMLCLVAHFLGRRIRDPQLWYSDLLPAVRTFARCHVHRGCRLLLDIQAICSVAFMVGYMLDPKLAVDVAVVQGASEWAVCPSRLDTSKPLWSYIDSGCSGTGHDIVVGVGITRDVAHAVKAYTHACLPQARRIVTAAPAAGPSVCAVQDGTHAFAMAEQLVAKLGAIRSEHGVNGTTHIFIAAPNAFSVYLGQVSRPLGRLQLYEYNFDRPEACEYWPSVSLDPSVSL